jgi:hypothetical protein
MFSQNFLSSLALMPDQRATFVSFERKRINEINLSKASILCLEAK